MKYKKIRFLAWLLSMTLFIQTVSPVMAFDASMGNTTAARADVQEYVESEVQSADQVTEASKMQEAVKVQETQKVQMTADKQEINDKLVTVEVDAEEMKVYQNGVFDVVCEVEEDDMDMSASASFYETYSEAIDYLYQQLKAKSGNIDLSTYLVPSTDISNLVFGCINEHPDLYFVDSYSYYMNPVTGDVISIIPRYIADYDDDLFNSAVEDAMAVIEPGMSDLEKAIALHDYIILNCEYNYDDLLADTLVSSDYNVYGILALKTGVCNGYALAYKLLCNLAGIECFMVSSDDMNHAWNLIKLNGEYYQVDTTWDDPVWDRLGKVCHFYMFSSDADFIANREHYNWVVTQYNVAVDLSATDKTYDDYFWMDIDSAMIYDNHDYYYIDKSDRMLKKINMTDMSTTEICSVGSWRTWENTGTWGGTFSGLFELNDRLYFNKMDGIYSIAPENTSDLVKEFANPQAEQGHMYGCAMQQGTVKYIIGQTPNAEQAWPVYTAQLEQEIVIPVSKVTFSEENYEVMLGNTFTLEYNVLPSYAKVNQVTWSSDNENVATVNDGIVTPVGVGTCHITVTIDGVSAVCEVTVTGKTEAPVFTPQSGNIDVGETVTITAQEGAVIYYTLDRTNPTELSEVYTEPIPIENYTVIKAFAVKEGYAASEIAVGVYTACNNELEFENAEFEVREEGTLALSFSKIPTTKSATDVTVTSSDESIARVDENHIVTGISQGQTTLTATVEDHKGRTVTAQAKITVVPSSSTYTVTFKYYNEKENTYITYDTQEIEQGGNAEPPEVTAPAGYEFTGWDSSYENIQEDKVIYAQFVLAEYGIVYEVGNGINAETNPSSYTIESETIILSAPTAPQGYTFAGWYKDSEFYYPVTQIEQGSYESLTLYAKYEPIRYSITYHLTEGENSSENRTEYTIETEDFILQDATGNYGAVFTGWYEDIEKTRKVTQISKGSMGDKTLYAGWQLVKPVFGKVHSQVLPGESITLEAAKTGVNIYYTTDGSIPSETSTLYTEPIVIDKEMTIKAVAVAEGYTNSEIAVMTYVPYEEKEFYTVQFLDLKGNLLKEELVEKNGNAEPPEVTAPVGYEFTGWDSSYENIQEDKVIYAQFVLAEYEIVYEVGNGINAETNPSSYTIESETIILSAPTASQGYTFAGWYKDSKFNESIMQIEKGSYESLTLYAKYDLIKYTINYELNGGAFGGNNPASYTVEDNIKLNDAEGKDGFVFAGWYEDSEFDGNPVSQIEKGRTGDFTLYAKWRDERGLWAEDIAPQDFTGKKVMPKDIKVYDGEELLILGKDYTLSYKNNVNANDLTGDDLSKAPAVLIKGKGNYTGSISKYFAIKRKSIEDEDIRIDAIALMYKEDKVQTPIPKVFWNGKSLKKDKDFKVTYVEDRAGAFSQPDEYTICVEGINNYSGKREITLTIAEAEQVLMSKVKITKIPNQIYNGKEVNVDSLLTLTYKNETLKSGYDYELKYDPCIETGTHDIIIIGKNNYAGMARTSFKITGISINKMQVTGIPAKVYYTGQEITEKDAQWEEVIEISSVMNSEGITLERDDYEIEYKNNINKGTAQIIITGKNGYTGTLKKTFKIVPYDINEDWDRSMSAKTVEKEIYYEKNGSKPEIQVTSHGTILELNKDYKVTYKNNNAAFRYSTAVITGIGNYTGKMEVPFMIESKKLTDVKIFAADKVEGKAGKYRSNPKLTDTNGKNLTAGKDYEIVEYLDEAGNVLEKTDIVKAGNKVTVKVYGIGNYEGEHSYTYRILEKGKDISKAKVSLQKGKKWYYTGDKVTVNKEDIVVKFGKNQLEPEDFEIVDYTNNTKKGTAKVTIRGKGEYGGTKQISFKISSQIMKWWEKILF